MVLIIGYWEFLPFHVYLKLNTKSILPNEQVERLRACGRCEREMRDFSGNLFCINKSFNLMFLGTFTPLFLFCFFACRNLLAKDTKLSTKGVDHVKLTHIFARS